MNLQRKVIGNLIDPASTRDLIGLSQDHNYHLALAFMQQIQLWEILEKLPDDEQMKVLNSGLESLSDSVKGQLQEEISKFQSTPIKDQQLEMEELTQALKTILERYLKNGVNQDWMGLSGLEFSLLIKGVQAGCGTLLTFQGLAPLDQQSTYERIKSFGTLNGIPQSFFQQFENASEFFEWHQAYLEEVLEVANAPYEEENAALDLILENQ